MIASDDASQADSDGCAAANLSIFSLDMCAGHVS